MGDDPIRVVPMRADQLDRATAVMTRAFFADPLFVTGYPDPGERARVVPACAAWCFRHAARFGTILVAGEEPVGVAHAYRSETPVFSDANVAASLGELQTEIGPDLWDRYARMQAPWEEADAALSAAVPGPQWYVDMLAVEPSHQGRGIGTALLDAVNALADADGWPATLLTFQPRNLPLYRRQGYEEVVTGVHQVSGVAYWCLRRPARPGDMTTP